MRRSSWVWLLVLFMSSVAGAQATRPATQPVTYLGRPVDDRWVSAQFEKFKDKIVLVDGRFLDIGRGLLRPGSLSKEPPAIGSVVSCGGRVWRVLDERQAVIGVRSGTDSLEWIVSGIDTSRLVDDQQWSGTGVYIGAGDVGGQRLQRYAVPRMLTRAEFEQAISGGFRLVEWRVVKSRGGSSIESKPVR